MNSTHTHNESAAVILDAAGYDKLADVLGRAFHQAAHGKGKERHAQALPFDEQPMQRLIDLYGPGFALGQAAKKAQESQRLPHDHAIAELLGAIVYLAGVVIAKERGTQAEGFVTLPEGMKSSPLLAEHVHVAAHANDNRLDFSREFHAQSWPKEFGQTCCGGPKDGCKGCPRV